MPVLVRGFLETNLQVLGGVNQRLVLDYSGLSPTFGLFADNVLLRLGSDSDSEVITYSDLSTLSFFVRGFSSYDVIGSQGSDRIEAADRGDSLVGGHGNDSLFGFAGADTLLGGDGDDCLVGGDGSDRLFGNLGNDELFLGVGGLDIASNYAEGGGGDDRFYNASPDDTIFGGQGIDRVFFDLPGTTTAINLDIATWADSVGPQRKIEAFGGRLTDGDDTVNTGFAELDLDGWLGNDHLILDYSGVSLTTGTRASSISLSLPFGTAESVAYRGSAPATFNLDGFESADILGSVGEDFVIGTHGDDRLRGQAGGDRLSGHYGNDTLIGGNGADVLNGGPGSDLLRGGAGNDRFQLFDDGPDQRDIALGGIGNDLFLGVGLADEIRGGPGRDIVEFKLAPGVAANLDLTDLRQTQSTYQSIEVFRGSFSDLADTINAGFAEFDLDGKDGDDHLIVDYSDRSALSGLRAQQVKLLLNVQQPGVTITLADGSTNHVALENFEALTVVATTGSDEITGSTGASHIKGRAGADILQAGGGPAVLYGGIGDDRLSAGPSNDSLFGGWGDDRFFLGAARFESSSDRAEGGPGNDQFLDVSATDTILGGEGTDAVFFNLSLTPEPVALDLESFANGSGRIRNVELVGGLFSEGDDTIIAGFAETALFAGGGEDHLVLDYSGASRVSGKLAKQIALELLSDTTQTMITLEDDTEVTTSLTQFESAAVTGTAGNDTIHATDGADLVFGAKGGDQLFGNAGDDTLKGGNGSDTLAGGAGADCLTGGNDGDTFILTPTRDDNSADTAQGGQGDDRFAGVGLNDEISGGAGTDVVTFDLGGMAQAASVSLDALADGFGPIRGVEGMSGSFSPLDDQIDAQFAEFGLDGGDGNDLLLLDYSGASLMSGRTARAVGLNLFSDDIAERVDFWGGDFIEISFRDFEAYSVTGSPGNDAIRAGDGDDTLNGGAGWDSLFGFDGADLIDGGYGQNQLYGGLGADVFLFGRAAGQNTVHDFEDGIDRFFVESLSTQPPVTGDDITITDQDGDALIAISYDGVSGSFLVKGAAGLVTADDFANVL